MAAARRTLRPRMGGTRTPGLHRLALLVLGMLCVVPSWAQSGDGATETGAEEASVSEQPLVLEEITVTARKRHVDIQDAPVSVSAVDAETLDRAAVTKLDDFNGYVPGLVVAKNDGAGRVIAIRGVGWETAQNLSTQPSVLLYVDGVYLANPLAAGLDLGDIERVEVLRGPQGTEFGQGTTGGAVNIITRKAEPGRTEGRLDVEAGSYNLLRGRARANLSFSDRTALAVSVHKTTRDGFAEIEGGTLDGYQLDDADVTTARVNLRWTPTDDLSAEISAYVQDSDQGGAAQRHIHDPNPDPRALTQDYPSTFALTTRQVSAAVTRNLPGNMRLKWLTGIQTLEKQQTVDGDRLTSELTAVNLTGFYDANFDILPYWDNDSDAWSSELNLSGAGAATDWVAGVYYLHHENTNDFLEAVAPGTPDLYPALDNPSPDTLPPFQPPLEFVETRTLTRKDAAAYGQLTHRVGPRLAYTLGARYQRETATDDTTQFWFIDSLQTTRADQLTWKAGLDLHLDDDHLLYTLVSTGWKNGGNNPGALNGALDVPVSFAPEEVTSYEVGSRNSFAERRVRLNIGAYYYAYRNYQFIQEDPVPFAGGTGNIPRVTLYGLETEAEWLMGRHWRLDGMLSAADGRIDSDLYTLDPVDFLNSGFGRFTETGVTDRASLRVNLRGNTPPKLVEESARLVLRHTRALRGGTVLTASWDFVYRGGFQYRVFNNPSVDSVPAYRTHGVHVEADFGGMPLVVSLGVTNLFDTDGVNSRYSNPFGLHTTSEEFIPPRQVIGRVQYRF